jgi:hypothetical protein
LLALKKLSQLCHVLLGACYPFLEFANALYGLRPDIIVRGGLLALRSGGAGRSVAAGAGEHLLDRYIQGAGHASECVALGVGRSPFSFDAATALAEDLEPHPRDSGTFGQLPDGQPRVLAPLFDPLAEGLPGCFVHVALAEVVRPGSGALHHGSVAVVSRGTMLRRPVSTVVDK